MKGYLDDSCNACGHETHALLQSINCICVALLCVELLQFLLKVCRNGSTFSAYLSFAPRISLSEKAG